MRKLPKITLMPHINDATRVKKNGQRGKCTEWDYIVLVVL